VRGPTSGGANPGSRRRGERRGVVVPALAALVLAGIGAAGIVFAPSSARAEDVHVSGSGRVDFNWLRRAPETASGVEHGATNLESWFELRALTGDWDAAARLRVHQADGIEDDSDREEIDRRHLAYRGPDVEILAGNFYTTFGNGLILRTLEQRFVTLNRADRAFNLDRNLDGVRVRVDHQRVRMTLLSGTPRRTALSTTAAGGATDAASGDLLQGGEAVVTPNPRLEAGFAFVRGALASPDVLWEGREREDLVSYRLGAREGAWAGQVEYAEIRAGGGLARGLGLERGYARYARFEGAVGPVGLSAEGKSYKDFGTFPYNQPPTLVRTHESVLLNRATHVLLPDDERGFQIEALYAPGYFTTFIANVAASDDSRHRRARRFREVFLSARTEREGTGAVRVELDWSRDRIKFVENRWTTALEMEGFMNESVSVIGDVELQIEDTAVGDITNRLVQIAVAKAGAWTIGMTGEHTDDRAKGKRDWLFVSADLRVSDRLDVTLGYGSRPAGLVCSGGFCFVSPAFDGAEFRLLSRF